MTRYFGAFAGSNLTPRVIAAIQTLASGSTFTPHLRCLVSEGRVDEVDLFNKTPLIDDSRLAELFVHEALAALSSKTSVEIAYG